MMKNSPFPAAQHSAPRLQLLPIFSQVDVASAAYCSCRRASGGSARSQEKVDSRWRRNVA